MKAIVYETYGSPDVLHLREIETPIHSDNQVLVKVHAASLNAADWRLLRADPFLVRLNGGLFKPKFPVLGADIAGKVEAVGKLVTRFKTGDEVFGNLFGCGMGGFAEYACANEDALELKPSTLSFEEAAAIPLAAITALQGLRNQGQIQRGQKVLIHGASGGVGTLAIQLAKLFGAEVTAVCSPRNIEQARRLGADHIIDYTKEDFTKLTQRYDLILAVNGFHALDDYQRALSPRGNYVMVGGSQKQMFQALLQGPWKTMTSKQKIGALTIKSDSNDLAFIKKLVESGRLGAVVDRSYPLAETAQAFRYLEEGHAKGKIIITVST